MMRSPVAATAKYRYGECLEKEGDVAGARGIYEQVRSEYAQTPEAILAGEKLEALRAGAREKSEAESGAAAPADGGDKSAASGFTLQFGSFGDRANAIKLAAELKGKVPGVRIDSELVNFKEVHRVRSGYFKTRAEAERMAEEIARRAGELGRRWDRHRPGIALADLVIAATAEHLGAELATTNVRHFPMFPELAPPYRA